MKTEQEIRNRIRELANTSYKTIDGNMREIEELRWVLADKSSD